MCVCVCVAMASVSECIQFDGSIDAVCPITLVQFPEIAYPIAFRDSLHQPYDANALAEWLAVRKTNPLTNMACGWKENPSEILVSLKPALACSSAAATGETSGIKIFLQRLQQIGGNVYSQVPTNLQIWANLWNNTR